MRAILGPEPGITKKILDIGTYIAPFIHFPCTVALEMILMSTMTGCGTGTWANEMAREFPHTETIGIDIAPTPVDAASSPPNVRFEINGTCSSPPSSKQLVVVCIVNDSIC